MKQIANSITPYISHYIREITSGRHEMLTLGFLLTGPMILLLGCIFFADLCRSKPRRYY